MICYPDGFILGIPDSLIAASPFKSLLVPGIILAFVVGGLHFTALSFFNSNPLKAYNWSMVAGLSSCGWVVVQFLLVQSVNGLQGVYLLIGICTLLLSIQLKSKSLI